MRSDASLVLNTMEKPANCNSDECSFVITNDKLIVTLNVPLPRNMMLTKRALYTIACLFTSRMEIFVKGFTFLEVFEFKAEMTGEGHWRVVRENILPA